MYNILTVNIPSARQQHVAKAVDKIYRITMTSIGSSELSRLVYLQHGRPLFYKKEIFLIHQKEYYLNFIQDYVSNKSREQGIGEDALSLTFPDAIREMVLDFAYSWTIDLYEYFKAASLWRPVLTQYKPGFEIRNRSSHGPMLHHQVSIPPQWFVKELKKLLKLQETKRYRLRNGLLSFAVIWLYKSIKSLI